ncbi:hypothetical protein GCM10025867_49600 (plasmid) [Frondihabitans sucicola]|uniref:Uncharacterized protein n=1 Tax=Frondihabitans sucicola TaxID=1268041 RepID=A0ABN6Y6M0_9MICO|nr:hypothetical protein [Frondihabitans sucicola]BDZ52719.1 hypothetical protein GCM10025867_49600 [Frondihabitans sucicola]
MQTTEKTLTEQSPVEIDTQLAALYADRNSMAHKLDIAVKHLASTKEEMERQSAANPTYRHYYYNQDRLDELTAEVAQLKADLARVIAEIAPFNAEFIRRGGWTRAFLVVSSMGGHVHSSMECSTCRQDTGFHWRPELSDHDELEIIAAAGERACTVCYPEAPVELIAKPTSIFSSEEITAAEARIERAAKKAERDAIAAAKLVIHPDGRIIQDRYGRDVKTEATVVTNAVNGLLDTFRHTDTTWPSHWDDAEVATYIADHQGIAERSIVALAHKHGVTVEAETDQIMAKVLPKLVKYLYGSSSYDAAVRREAELKALKAKLKAK